MLKHQNIAEFLKIYEELYKIVLKYYFDWGSRIHRIIIVDCEFIIGIDYS